MSIIFVFILLHSWRYISGSFQSAQIIVGLGRFYSHDRQGPRQNFLLPETNMSTSELKATSLISIHISVTKSPPNDSSKAAEEDIGQAGKLPGDTSASNHSHSRHRLTGLMIFQETHGRHKS